MQRRSFMAAMLAACTAPAAIGSGILMPVKKLIIPELVPFPYQSRDPDAAMLHFQDIEKSIMFGIVTEQFHNKIWVKELHTGVLSQLITPYQDNLVGQLISISK